MKVLPLSPLWQVEFTEGTKRVYLKRFPETNIFESLALRSRMASWVEEPGVHSSPGLGHIRKKFLLPLPQHIC